MRNSLPLRFRLSVFNEEMEEENIGELNILAMMFRKIKGDLNVSSRVWSSLMNRYLKDPRNQVLQTSRGRSSERSNVNRGLANPGMTFSNFIKGIRLFNPEEFVFNLEIELPDDITIRKMVKVNQDMLYTEYHNKKFPDRQNLLATIFRDIKNILDVNEAKWRTLMTQYLDNPQNGFLIDDLKKGGKRSSERSNLTRGLSNPDMSIKVFTKGIKVFNPISVTLSCNLLFHDGRFTKHVITVSGTALSAGPDEE